MLVAGLPIYSLVFLFGGISPGQLGVIFLFFVLTMFTVGSIGIMYSTITKKTIVSMIATYGTMIFLAGMTGFFYLISIQVNMIGGMTSVSPSLLGHFWASINPAILIFALLNPTFEAVIQESTQIEFPIWAGYTIFYLLLSATVIFISIKKLRVNMKKSK
jgi:hypothetical protein